MEFENKASTSLRFVSFHTISLSGLICCGLYLVMSPFILHIRVKWSVFVSLAFLSVLSDERHCVVSSAGSVRPWTLHHSSPNGSAGGSLQMEKQGAVMAARSAILLWGRPCRPHHTSHGLCNYSAWRLFRWYSTADGSAKPVAMVPLEARRRNNKQVSNRCRDPITGI